MSRENHPLDHEGACVTSERLEEMLLNAEMTVVPDHLLCAITAYWNGWIEEKKRDANAVTVEDLLAGTAAIAYAEGLRAAFRVSTPTVGGKH